MIIASRIHGKAEKEPAQLRPVTRDLQLWPESAATGGLVAAAVAGMIPTTQGQCQSFLAPRRQPNNHPYFQGIAEITEIKGQPCPLQLMTRLTLPIPHHKYNSPALTAGPLQDPEVHLLDQWDLTLIPTHSKVLAYPTLLNRTKGPNEHNPTRSIDMLKTPKIPKTMKPNPGTNAKINPATTGRTAFMTTTEVDAVGFRTSRSAMDGPTGDFDVVSTVYNQECRPHLALLCEAGREHDRDDEYIWKG